MIGPRPIVLAVIVDLVILSVGRLATPWTRAKAPA